ncbi:MAG: septum formation initiator family protein, partial [bacterium]|nr:septum formation initiator family protein [bacterium]
LLIILVTFILILTFFFGDSGIFELIKARDKINSLEQDIEVLEKEKKQLVEEIEELKTEPEAYERKAREKLWLMKKNEKVVVIIKNKDKKKNAPGNATNKQPPAPAPEQ